MTQNTGKKCSENASKKVQKLKIFYPGEGGTPSPGTPSPADSPLWDSSRSRPPPGKKLVAPLPETLQGPPLCKKIPNRSPSKTNNYI